MTHPEAEATRRAIEHLNGLGGHSPLGVGTTGKSAREALTEARSLASLVDAHLARRGVRGSRSTTRVAANYIFGQYSHRVCDTPVAAWVCGLPAPVIDLDRAHLEFDSGIPVKLAVDFLEPMQEATPSAFVQALFSRNLTHVINAMGAQVGLKPVRAQAEVAVSIAYVGTWLSAAGVDAELCAERLTQLIDADSRVRGLARVQIVKVESRWIAVHRRTVCCRVDVLNGGTRCKICPLRDEMDIQGSIKALLAARVRAANA